MNTRLGSENTRRRFLVAPYNVANKQQQQQRHNITLILPRTTLQHTSPTV